jgi:phenylacetate-CoA ligase
MDKMDTYYKSPIFVQNIACYLQGKQIVKNRYSQHFWNYLNDYEARNDWTYEQLIQYRDAKLQRMIKHCYETVPYYKDLFDEKGINYNEIKTLDDLKILPILTKDIVKKNYNDFISKDIPKEKMVLSHTSGTTGSGFKFYTTKDAISEQWAVWWRYRKNLGIEFDTWCALFGGRNIVSTNQNKPPYWRINSPCKQVYFSAYHMSEKNIGHYIDELNKRKLVWIHGYPSSINLVAEYMISNNINLSYKVKSITTGAENLMLSQIEKIEKAFGIKPYQHYGLSEGIANFSQNRYRDMFVDEDFAAVEFVNRDDAGFDVFGTSLSNYAMPFLRYKTGDVTEVKTTSKGRLVTSIDGRNEDYVTLPNEVRIGRLDHIFKDMINIIEAQIVQKRKSEVILKIVKNDNFSSKDEIELRKEATQRLKDVDIIIKYVNEIPRTKNGKLRFVISDIK